VPVYKCPQPNGSVLYADYPCAGAVALEVQRGVVDPDAIRRLERAQAEFDRAYARRMASEEMAAIRREEMNRRSDAEAAQRLAESTPYPPDAGYVSPYGFYSPYVGTTPGRPDPRPHAKHHRGARDGRVPAMIRKPRNPG
jgi:hypothetical protein